MAHLTLLNSLTSAVARSLSRAAPYRAAHRLPLVESRLVADWGRTLAEWLALRTDGWFTVDPLGLAAKIEERAWARIASRSVADEADVVAHLEERQTRLVVEHALWSAELLGTPGERDTAAWSRRRARADRALRAPRDSVLESTQAYDARRVLACVELAAVIDIGGASLPWPLLLAVARGLLCSDDDGRVPRLAQQVDEQARAVLRGLYDGE